MKSRSGLLVALLVFFLTAGMQPCLADAGVPMLAVMGPPMWALLVIIIPLEALIARKILSIAWSKCWKVSGIANSVSTIAGMPLTWALLVAGEMGMGFVTTLILKSSHTSTVLQPLGAGGKFAFFLTTIPWLWPIESDLYWMGPTAALLLLIPFFYVSVWIEYLVARKLLKSQDRQQVLNWAWRANYASYSLMAVVAVGWLAVSVVQHNKIAGDEEHRNVDQVAADRLWQLAIAKDWKSRDLRKAASPAVRYEGRSDRDIDKLYWEGRYQLECGRPEAAEKAWQAGLAKIDEEKYQRLTDFKTKRADGVNIVSQLAELYFKQGRLAEAEPLYERLSAFEDERLEKADSNKFQMTFYPLHLGDVYEKLDKADKAGSYYQHVIDQIGKLKKTAKTDAIHWLIDYGDFCNRQHNFKKAEELYLRAVNTNEPHVYAGESAHKSLAEFYMSRGQFEAAEKTLLAALKKGRAADTWQEFPGEGRNAPLALDLGKCYLETGNLAEAEHYIKVSMRGNSNLPESAKAYAMLLERRGDSQQAKLWQERAKEAEKLRESESEAKVK